MAAVTTRRPLLIGYANAVTSLRALLGLVVAVPIFSSLFRELDRGVVPVWVVPVTVVALLLDGVDGAVARRTHTESAFGARFDIEVDSALVMLLCLPVAVQLGWWVMVIGAARYLWLAAIAIDRRIGTPVPSAYWRKVIGMVQPVALLIVLLNALPHRAELGVILIAIAGLVVSFGSQGLQAVRLAHRSEPAD